MLPKDPKQKLVFIAGGIGVTPYRSMIKYLLDKNEKRDITLLYSARTTRDFAYKDVFEDARRELGIKTIYAVTSKESTVTHEFIRSGRISTEMVKAEVPDYQDSLFYISGTNAMVKSMQETLEGLGVPKHQVKVDYFSGYS